VRELDVAGLLLDEVPKPDRYRQTQAPPVGIRTAGLLRAPPLSDKPAQFRVPGLLGRWVADAIVKRHLGVERRRF